MAKGEEFMRKTSKTQSKSIEKEHILSKDCWCNPKVIKVAPKKRRKQTANSKKAEKTVSWEPFDYPRIA